MVLTLFFSFQVTGAGIVGTIGGRFPVNNGAELKAGLKEIERELTDKLDLSAKAPIAKEQALPGTRIERQSRIARKKAEDLPMRKRFAFPKRRDR